MAQDVLGPVMHFYLVQLDHHIRQLDDGNTTFLFASRAGVRILELYERYLALSGLERPASLSHFWISRFQVCKGIYGRQPELSINSIGRELAHSSLAETVRCLFRSEIVFGGLQPPEEWNRLPAEPLHQFITSDDPVARQVREYLDQQSNLFASYLAQSIGAGHRAVLIDSGWQGTAQALLIEAFPEYDWYGVYFGRSFLGAPNPNVVENSIGLVFEGDAYDPRRPETAIVLHRHLIESLLEPSGPSIERLALQGEAVVAPEAPLILDDQRTEYHDGLYLGVLDYIEQSAAIGHAEMHRRARQALVQLARLLSEPSPDEARAMMGKRRSADFGRHLEVDPLLAKTNGADASDRIRKALWFQGQVALEYPAVDARRIQRAQVKHPGPQGASDPWALQGRVAIITRTKDRPVLLVRAAESVARQTYENYVWVVVNDGGMAEPVREILAECAVDPRRILLCDNERSLGMEAASNVGIRQSESEFIVIHDDDDSWASEFLNETVSFLRSPGGRKYGGVITKSVYVSEEIVGDRVVEHARLPYQDWVEVAHLSEMANGNFFPPIAFVFRRAICEQIGGFDEQLPVLGDWDFNLRFLLKADIGVLPMPLAFYHHRDVGGTSAEYSNSVIGGISKHQEYSPIVRNKYIRNPEFGPLAALMSSGYGLTDLRNRLGGVQHSISSSPVQRGRIAASNSAFEHLSGLADERWVALQLLSSQTASPSPCEMAPAPARMTARELREAVHRSKLFLIAPPDFDDQAYRASYKDVDAAVANGDFSSGFHHYFLFGREEGRTRPLIYREFA
jgi:glycosyltransferase involved in cell wall biosynthesis